MARLLVIACSQRKAQTKKLLPALDRYDGPAFRVLRKHLREMGGNGLVILILSAKYGLIASNRKIPNYDCRLSVRAADELQPRVLEVSRTFVASKPWTAVGICAGKDYQRALQGFSGLIPPEVPVSLIRGGQGPRLTALKKWLHQSS